MKLNELIYANDLQSRIKRIKEECELIEKLEDRIEETTNDCQQVIYIQIAEAYIRTPAAKVNLERFKGFLKNELVNLQRQITNLELEFEGFQTKGGRP